MKRIKRVGITSLMICLPIILILIFNINEDNKEETKIINGDSSNQEPVLRVEDTNTYPKLSWAVDMPKEDILYQTGFEDGDELPELKFGDRDKAGGLYAGQSFTTEDAYSGKYSLKVKDSYTNGHRTGNMKLDGTYNYSNNSRSTFSRKYIKDGTDLSLSFRAKTTGVGSIRFMSQYDIVKEGQPININLLEDVKVGDKVVKVSDVSYFQNYINQGKRYYLIAGRGKNQPLAWAISTDSKNSTITLNRGMTTEFKKGDKLLERAGVYPINFNSKGIQLSKDWELYNSNEKVIEVPYYNTLTEGFSLVGHTTTRDTVYIDDLKVGYATKTKLYRDNKQVYEGKLSDYEDKQARDITAPNKVDEYTVHGKDNKQYIHLTEPKDNGTTYKYRVDAVSKEGNVYPSKTENVKVMSGFKGYSYVIDNNSTTEPNNTVNSTDGKIEIDKSKGTYLHIKSLDNEGNASETVTYKVQNLIDEIPTIEFIDVPTKWIKEGFYYRVYVQVKEGNSVHKLLDNDGEQIESPYRRNITENGNYKHTVYDNKGNTNEVVLKVENIDKIKPELSIKQSNTEWTNKNITLTATGIDRESGIEGVRLSNDSTSNNIVSLRDIRGYNLTDQQIDNNKLIITDTKGASTAGVYIPYTKIEKDKEYVLSYDIKKLDGDVDRLGGHLQVAKKSEYYIDGNKQDSGYPNPYSQSGDLGNLNDGKSHHVTVKFKADNWEVTNRNIYIQPNRKKEEPYKVEVSNIQLEEGTEETPYTPNSSDLPTNDNPLQIEVVKNGTYTFIAKDKAGNEISETIEVTNIDKEAPKITVTQSTDEITHEDITLTVQGKDELSGIKSIKYLGENMVQNGDFSEKDRYWIQQTGVGRIETNLMVMDESSEQRTKFYQPNAFKNDVEGTRYYAEVIARGKGVLNVRYGQSTGGVPEKYKTNLSSETEFKKYRFLLERNENSNNSLILERIGEGYTEIKEVKVFAEKDLTEKGLTVKENGQYTFVAEDNAGNITTKTHEVTNIDKGIRLTAPNELNLGTSKIGNKIQGKLSNVIIEDWRDGGNNWRLQVGATPLQNKDTKEILEKGMIQLDGKVTSNKLEGDGNIPVPSYVGYKGIDLGKVDILQGKESRGKYSMEFGKDSIKVNIDPTQFKTGEYESKLTWDLVQAP